MAPSLLDREPSAIRGNQPQSISRSAPFQPPAMHASQLLEIAALVASHRSAFLDSDSEHWSAERYWVASRSRLYEWAGHLKMCQELRHESQECRQDFWKLLQPALEEIFLAEVCTRVWCATLSMIDHDRSNDELDPIARSVFVANLEARRRALRLLLFARGLGGISTIATDQLRRDCEQWTDLLLSQLSPSRIAQQYCFDRKRMRARPRQTRHLHSDHIWQLELVGMRYKLATRTKAVSLCPELNSELGETLLSCLPVSIFDGVGTPRLGWSADAYRDDEFSFDIANVLCGNSSRGRYDVKGGLKDRR